MKQIKSWALKAVSYLYDPTQAECAEVGMREMRNRIHTLLIEQDNISAENIKNNPELASYLLLEVAEKVKTLGEENV